MKDDQFKDIDGSVTAPSGFSAAGVHAGLKVKDLDMAMIASDRDAHVAGTFTTNKIQGATVKLCRDLLASGHSCRAVVINSKNANACNGPRGLEDAAKMGQLTAEKLCVDTQSVYVCSTGTIGVPLPMDKIEAGIKSAVGALSESGGDDAAKAIMTTDTVDKQAAVEISIDGVAVRIGGISKGSGMIEPNMATMLAFVTTDAAVERAGLQTALSKAVELSFNRISVDGDQSCNDTVLVMANGAAGNNLLNESHPDWSVFVGALEYVTRTLALKIVKDGEGATKFVTVTVNGASTNEDAKTATRKIANSLLVKTSWFGCDPNWGRVIDVVGYSGADVKEELVEIWYDDVCAVKNGCAVEGMKKDLEAVLVKDEFTVTVDLNMGDGRDTVYTCDCSEEYVRINSEYTT